MRTWMLVLPAMLALAACSGADEGGKAAAKEPEMAAPDTPAPPTPETRPDTPQPDAAPVVGGYGTPSPEAPGLKEAQALATDAIYKRDPQRSTVASVTPEVQVVAGLNYRFTIEMSTRQRYVVTVYRDLKGHMQVTEFEKLPAKQDPTSPS